MTRRRTEAGSPKLADAETSAPPAGDNVVKGGVQAERLRSFVERIERLEEERRATAGDIREVYAEAKSAGYDTKVMRQVIRERLMDTADRQEQEALLDVYRRALGGYADTPLGRATIARVESGDE